MLFLSKVSLAALETLSFVIIYQLCLFKRRDSKQKLGVFFSLIFFMNFMLSKEIYLQLIAFYAILIVITNGLLKYEVKVSCFYSIQAFMISISCALLTGIINLYGGGLPLNIIEFWGKASWIDGLFYMALIFLLSFSLSYCQNRIRKKAGISRAIANKVRIHLNVTFVVFILITVCLYAYLIKYWTAIEVIPFLKYVLLIGYVTSTGAIAYFGYMSIYNINFMQKFDRIAQMAENDPLSGLMSRSAGMNFLRKSFNLAKASGQRLTIAFVDINDLKVVNDKHGHHTGDFLIEKIAEVLRANIRDTDGAMRFGGDEFVLIMPDCPQYRAEEIMKQINIYLNRYNLSGTYAFKLGVSFGLVEYNPSRHSSALDMLAEADTEMYKNKRKNKHSNM